MNMKTTSIEINLLQKAKMLNTNQDYNGFFNFPMNANALEKTKSYLNAVFKNFYPKSTIEIVFENLDIAMDNEYNEMMTDPVNDIADDLQRHSSTIEDLNISNNELSQIIELWRTLQT